MNRAKHFLTIVGSVGIPARYGGFETLAEKLALNLASRNHLIRVTCDARAYNKSEKCENWQGVELKYIPIGANGIGSLLHDALGLIVTIKDTKCFLLLGVSGAWFLPILRLLTKARVVTNIDGLEHRREKWNLPTRLLLRVLESIAVRCSDEIICDNQALVDYVRLTYGSRATLITYGGFSESEAISLDNINVLEDYGLKPFKYMMSVCRVEPENKVREILEAYVKSQRCTPLVFVGNWKHSDYSRKLFELYKRVPNIRLMMPIYDRGRLYNLRKYSVGYIHGHSAGGTNPSLVEALTSGTEAICFDVSYNRFTTADMQKYFSSREDLAEILSTQFLDPDFGLRARSLAHACEEYDWNKVCLKYEKAMLGHQ